MTVFLILLVVAGIGGVALGFVLGISDQATETHEWQARYWDVCSQHGEASLWITVTDAHRQRAARIVGIPLHTVLHALQRADALEQQGRRFSRREMTEAGSLTQGEFVRLVELLETLGFLHGGNWTADGLALLEEVTALGYDPARLTWQLANHAVVGSGWLGGRSFTPTPR